MADGIYARKFGAIHKEDGSRIYFTVDIEPTAFERVVRRGDALADVFGVRRDRDDRGGKHVDDILRGLPYGKVLCIVRITGIEETNPMMLEGIAGREQLFGNYEEGRYAWHLHMVDVFEPPIPAKGNRMLWNWKGQQ